MSFSKLANKNVSSSGINRQERVIVSQLKVIVGPLGNIIDDKNRKRSSVRSSIVWQYFGALHHCHHTTQVPTSEIDKNRVYCR